MMNIERQLYKSVPVYVFQFESKDEQDLFFASFENAKKHGNEEFVKICNEVLGFFNEFTVRADSKELYYSSCVLHEKELVVFCVLSTFSLMLVSNVPVKMNELNASIVEARQLNKDIEKRYMALQELEEKVGCFNNVLVESLG